LNTRDDCAHALASARRFTERITAGVADHAAARQFDPLFSPIAWHFGHIAWQEEVWVLRRAAREPPIEPYFDAIFDSFVSPKDERALAVPPLSALRRYAAEVRERTLALLARGTFDSQNELLNDGYVFRFIANHERQHAEHIGIVRLLGEVYLETPDDVLAPQPSPRRNEYVRVPGGHFVLGAESDPDAWDNESPCRTIEIADFALQRAPVTCGDWLEFMTAGGYEDGRLWSEAGNAFRASTGLTAPLYWSRDEHGAYHTRSLAGPCRVQPVEAVSHVSWYEAEAYARFAGARLPSEPEWEHATSWDAAGGKRRWPWGNEATVESANLSLRRARPSRRGEFPESALGFEDLVGGCWEWSESVFAPYPGFRPQAYRGYSEPWFDGRHRIARGGCFLTQPEIARTTFRNWYLPEIRQVPLGLRLARF